MADHKTGEVTLKERRLRGRLLTRPIQVGLDLFVLASAFLLAYGLRFEFSIRDTMLLQLLAQLPLAVLVQLFSLLVAGIYSFVWRYVGMAELGAFVKAAVGSTAALLLFRFGLPSAWQHWRIPLSVILIDGVLAFGGVLGLRLLRRTLYEHLERSHSRAGRGAARRKPVLLVGAGRAGVLAAREIQNRGDLGLDIRGFIDDDPEKIGTVIQGVKVLGGSREIPRLVAERDVDHVVITIAKASRSELRRLIEICERVPVKARIIPGLYEIIDGSVEVSRIRDVEIEDLLGRDAVKLDEEVVRDFIAGKTVMVTGAGGSIGSELARQVARFGAGSLLLVERAEFALFDIDREIRLGWPDRTVVPLVADVADRERMHSLLQSFRPSVVVHAAAHKHVPLMETNPTEAVKNNILGTRLLAELAGEAERGYVHPDLDRQGGAAHVA